LAADGKRVTGLVHIEGSALATAYRGRADAFPEAVRAGLRRIMVQVHRAADANLSGGGEAWSMPVPRRSGALARGMYSELRDDQAEIGNQAPHAWAIHTGEHPLWSAPPAVERPFLDEAVAGVDHLDIIQQEMVRGRVL
jgi:hypothetical protein